MQARIDRIGTARAPVVVIEGLSGAADALVEHAAAMQAQFHVRSKLYPGVRTPAPASYRQALVVSLSPIVRSAFEWQGDIEVTESNFSLVTTPPSALAPFQRIPHFDGTDTEELAVLHYLCRPHQGGTSFYRHRSTGYETITRDCLEAYIRTLNADAATQGLPSPQYVNGNTPLFERIAQYDAAFDRALIYRGSSLHSGDIPADFVPDPDPRSGRLTVNSFLRRVG
jgi:hypothetical protein